MNFINNTEKDIHVRLTSSCDEKFIVVKPQEEIDLPEEFGIKSGFTKKEQE